MINDLLPEISPIFQNASETQERRHFRELKSKTFPGGAWLGTFWKLVPSVLVVLENGHRFS